MAAGRLLQIHAGIYLLGALLLLAIGWPAATEDGLGLDSVSWPLLLIPAALFGVVGGLLEGLTFRSGSRDLGWPVLAVAAAFGAAAPLFFVGRWPGESWNDPIDAGLLVAAELGWAAFILLFTVIAVPLSRR